MAERKRMCRNRIKKIYIKLEDIGAEAINRYDTFAERGEKRLLKLLSGIKSGLSAYWDKITGVAASLVEGYDFLSQKLDRRIYIIHYETSKRMYAVRKRIDSQRKNLMIHFTAIVLCSLAAVALYSYSTGYAYSYNGRRLGYVENQEDVLKILDIVSDELSREYGTIIEIDKEKDINFKRTYVLDKDVDDINTVLKRLSYMSDMQAEGCAIMIDGRQYIICESKKTATEILDAIKEKYIDKERKDEYQRVTFKEDVEIKKTNVKLAWIMNREKAINKLMAGGMAEKVYIVQPGDTYYGICKENNTTFEQLKLINPDLDINSLFPGDEIKISLATAAVTVVTVEKTTFPEVVPREVVEKQSDKMYVGDWRLAQEGSDGKQLVTAILTKENGEIVKRADLKTEMLQEPVPKIIVRGTKPTPRTAPTGKFICPLSRYTITSGFGWRWGRMHEGVDLAAPVGTVIRAADGGTVTRVGWYGGYGLCIDINHGKGVMTRYGHCNTSYVSVGEEVYQGQAIGEVGRTGNTTGSHLHFEIRINGAAVNPMAYL